MTPGPASRTLYRIDSTRVSLQEYWWGVRSPAIVIAALLKLLRVRLPSSTDDPNVAALAPWEVDPAALGESFWTRFADRVQELENLGFHSPVVHRIEDDLHKTETCLISFVHPPGLAVARIHERTWRHHIPNRQSLFTEFITPLEGGGFVWSLSSKPDLKAPPNCRVVRRTGAGPTELWRAHQAALEGMAPAPAMATVSSPEALRALLERHHAMVRDFHLSRGVFAALSEKEQRAQASNQAGREAAEAAGSRYPEVLAEIRSIETAKSNWTTGVIVLIVSLALFTGAGGLMAPGSQGLAFKDLLILIPVLFFHEGGHWIAMRLFGYRNLRMFFIPFLGAAVSGQHYNVAGWKKAVVSLMGPLPGIVAGSMLAVVGLAAHSELMMQIALTALILNGMNLLPILPFDGGWVVQAILASRQMFFEVAFRLFAVGLLLALGLYSGDWILLFLGFIMLVSLPVSYKLARITRDLRRSPLAPTTPDDQMIPAPIAEAIVARVAEAFPGAPGKQAAQHTLQIFESLNARPPGILASIGLGLIQAAGLVAALVFSAVVVVGRQADPLAFLQSAAELPRYTLDPATMAVGVASGPSTVTLEPHNTLVATFGSVEEAWGAMAEVEREPPSRLAVAVLERTLLLALPEADDASRRRWLETLQKDGVEVFVATPEAPASMRLSCLASTAENAQTIEQETSDYFHAADLGVIPPWSEQDSRTPADRLAHARARRTYARLRVEGSAANDPGMEDFASRMKAALRAGDTVEVKRLRAERLRLTAELRAARLAKLGAEEGMDAAVVNGYQGLLPDSAERADSEKVAASIGSLLGQMRVDGDRDPANRAVAAAGYLTRQGLLLNLPILTFGSTFAGPPALVRWLQARGCTDFRYDFMSPSDLEDIDPGESP